MSEQEIFDLGSNFIRTQLATIQGASAFPRPMAGKQRMVMVDINPEALFSRGLSATDVSAALNKESVILPTGERQDRLPRISRGDEQHPSVVDQFNRLPVKSVNGSTIYMRDIAQVRDGYMVQTNIVRHNGDAARC